MADLNTPPPTEHEFDAEQNEVFSGLSGAMRFVAVIMIVLGSLYAVSGVLSMSVPVVAVIRIALGVCVILIGGWVYSAGIGFRDIVRTEGNDLTNLMHAIRKLRSAFLLQGWLMAIQIALIVLVFAYAILALQKSH